MTHTDTTRSAGCLCGAVRFSVTGPLQPLIACHCRDCQRMSGAYFLATAAGRSAIRFDRDDGLAWCDSSQTSRRGFCRACGSSLFFDHGPDTPWGISAGAFDRSTDQPIAAHIYVDCAHPGLVPRDETPKFTASEWANGGWESLRSN